MLSRQEIFDIVYTGLRNQGWHRSAHKEFCMYRAANGKKCAFGFLIPDELYHPSFEDVGAVSLVFSDKPLDNVSYKALIELREWAKETLSSDNSIFINGMQSAHDNGFSPEIMKDNFDKMAATYKMKIPD